MGFADKGSAHDTRGSSSAQAAVGPHGVARRARGGRRGDTERLGKRSMNSQGMLHGLEMEGVKATLAITLTAPDNAGLGGL